MRRLHGGWPITSRSRCRTSGWPRRRTSTRSWRARAANLELLDELLAALTDSGELPAAVRSRLRHREDRCCRTTAGAAGPAARRPSRPACTPAAAGTSRVPRRRRRAAGVLHRRDWEYDLIDDLPLHPEQRNLHGDASWATVRRCACRFVSTVVSSPRSRSCRSRRRRSSTADILIARRIADRIALSLSRERGSTRRSAPTKRPPACRGSSRACAR